MRIHVASFDPSESPDYNRENCDIAADLFSLSMGSRQNTGVRKAVIGNSPWEGLG
jgi:hypothetical protein